MKRNNFFSRFIVVTLLSALLLVSGSRAICVSALADPVPITAVYDTQIIQLADYVDHLPAPSVDLFYVLTGVLAAAQLGGQEYKLEDPYATSSDVLDWFKSMGIRFYNTMIGLAPNVDPILGFDMRPYIKPLVAAVMGNAVMARNYGSIDNFMESEDEVVIPFQKDIQMSINRIWQLTGGPYDWQFTDSPWISHINYAAADFSQVQQDQYNTIFNGLLNVSPPLRINSISRYSTVAFAENFNTYRYLFIDIDDNNMYICDEHNNHLPTSPGKFLTYSGGSITVSDVNYRFYDAVWFNANDYDNYVDLAQDFFDNVFRYSPHSDIPDWFWSDLIDVVYIGNSWLDKHVLQNIYGLNISDDGNPYYYNEVQDDILIDIKNLITDLVGDTDIWTNIINNVYDPDGTHIVDLPTIRVSVDLSPITELLDPPVPVDLNDIAELTENTYLERIKEHARNAGDIFANYVAFWHNCDSDLVYTMFGAVILVLVGAFVGKWGHS